MSLPEPAPAERVHLKFDEPKPYHPVLADLADRHTPSGGSVVDLGCGYGQILQGLADRRPDLQLTGIDENADFLAAVEDRVPGITTVQGDIDRAEHLGRRFDTVLMSHVLEHTYAPAQVVRDLLASMVTPGGVLILAVPNPAQPVRVVTNVLRRHYANRGHVYAWDPSHWRVFLETALGLEVVEYGHDVVRMFPRRLVRLLPALGRLEGALAQLVPWWSRSNIAVIRRPH